MDINRTKTTVSDSAVVNSSRQFPYPVSISPSSVNRSENNTNSGYWQQRTVSHLSEPATYPPEVLEHHLRNILLASKPTQRHSLPITRIPGFRVSPIPRMGLSINQPMTVSSQSSYHPLAENQATGSGGLPLGITDDDEFGALSFHSADFVDQNSEAEGPEKVFRSKAHVWSGSLSCIDENGFEQSLSSGLGTLHTPSSVTESLVEKAIPYSTQSLQERVPEPPRFLKGGEWECGFQGRRNAEQDFLAAPEAALLLARSGVGSGNFYRGSTPSPYRSSTPSPYRSSTPSPCGRTMGGAGSLPEEMGRYEERACPVSCEDNRRNPVLMGSSSATAKKSNIHNARQGVILGTTASPVNKMATDHRDPPSYQDHCSNKMNNSAASSSSTDTESDCTHHEKRRSSKRVWDGEVTSRQSWEAELKLTVLEKQKDKLTQGNKNVRVALDSTLLILKTLPASEFVRVLVGTGLNKFSAGILKEADLSEILDIIKKHVKAENLSPEKVKEIFKECFQNGSLFDPCSTSFKYIHAKVIIKTLKAIIIDMESSDRCSEYSREFLSMLTCKSTSKMKAWDLLRGKGKGEEADFLTMCLNNYKKSTIDSHIKTKSKLGSKDVGSKDVGSKDVGSKDVGSKDGYRIWDINDQLMKTRVQTSIIPLAKFYGTFLQDLHGGLEGDTANQKMANSFHGMLQDQMSEISEAVGVGVSRCGSNEKSELYAAAVSELSSVCTQKSVCPEHQDSLQPSRSAGVARRYPTKSTTF